MVIDVVVKWLSSIMLIFVIFSAFNAVIFTANDPKKGKNYLICMVVGSVVLMAVQVVYAFM